MTTTRKEVTERKEEILKAALKVAAKVGFNNFTRIQVANEVGCAESLISAHFGTMIEFKRKVMRKAVQVENLTVIAQGLTSSNAIAKKAPYSVKKRAMKSIAV